MLKSGEELAIPTLGTARVVAEIGRGGQSQSFKVEVSGRAKSTHYFVKFFMEPTKPKGGSAAMKSERAKRCELFERRRRVLYAKANEAHAISRQVINNYGLHSRGSRYYVVQQYVRVLEPKERAAASMREALYKLPPLNRLDVIIDAAEGIAAMHGVGLVHGDVKLDNLAIYQAQDDAAKKTKDRLRCRLIDYCDGYLVDEPRRFGAAFETKFDTSTAAPEVLRFSLDRRLETAAILGQKADVFALAVVAIEVLTGVLPAEPGATIMRGGKVVVATSRIPPPNEDIRALLNRALDQSPDVRPTAAEMLAAFRSYAGQIDPARRPVSETVKYEAPIVQPVPAGWRPPRIGQFFDQVGKSEADLKSHGIVVSGWKGRKDEIVGKGETGDAGKSAGPFAKAPKLKLPK